MLNKCTFECFREQTNSQTDKWTSVWITNGLKLSRKCRCGFVCVVTLFNGCRSIVFRPHVFGWNGALSRQYCLHQKTEELICRSETLGCTFWRQNIHFDVMYAIRWLNSVEILWTKTNKSHHRSRRSKQSRQKSGKNVSGVCKTDAGPETITYVHNTNKKYN